MRNVAKRILAVFVAAVVPLVGFIEFEHRYNYGHFVGYSLHADAVRRYAYIGIPGQTHMYNAQISNFTFFPVMLTGCDYVTDAMGNGTEYPYAVQRWDPSLNNWQTIVEVSAETFCHPVPLSTIETNVTDKWIWPGMTLDASDGEATGAREPFHKGDMARFVVFRKLGTDNDWQYAVPSRPFYIEDEVIRDENSFRLKH